MNPKLIIMNLFKRKERMKEIKEMSESVEDKISISSDVPEFSEPSVSSPDSLKIDPKTAEEIMNKNYIDLPMNRIKPVNGRMFCLEVDTGEIKTKSGLILPTSHTKQKGEQQVKKEIKRYFVIDIALDCHIKFVPFGQYNPRKIQRGDEVFPFFPEEMIEWSLPKVIDWQNNGMRYCVLHESEIAGICNSLVIDKDK